MLNALNSGLKEWQRAGWKPEPRPLFPFIPEEWGADRVITFKDPKTGDVLWQSNPGPQSYALLCPADMILYGGSRGGGKSACLIAWFAMGDATLPADCPARESYLNDPNYRALVVRESAQDLRDFVDEAEKFYEVFGARKFDDPAIFEFPSGAKIFTNHLGNKDSFGKYKGWNLVRIATEELTLIEDRSLFMKLLGANRSKWPWLRPQNFNTTNPDGPGSPWVKEFFVEPMGMIGGEVRPVPWGHPSRDPITKLTRIFIPAKLDDNPHLCHDDHYRGMLLSQDPDTRAAWLEGRWDGSTGLFFKEFRPNGPHPGEEKLYPWARHVIPPVELPYWYHRWVGGDWGFDHPAAFYKFCLNERDGRVHTYDELVTRGVGSFQLGVELAKWLRPELESLPDHRLVLHLSPDAFSKTDDINTRAEQIEAGIRSYLGPYAAFLMEYSADEKRKAKTDPAGAAKDFTMRQNLLSGQMCILIKRANNDRPAGAAFIRDLLRFIPAVPEIEPDLIHAQNLYQTKGLAAYVDYMERFKEVKAEVLPKWVIHQDKCPALVKCMGTLIHDDKRKEDVKKVDGDDPYDGCLIAGTLVKTARGDIAIESVTADDLVLTRSGWKPVLASAMTNPNAQVFRVECSNGAVVTGTANHPVFVHGAGFVPISELKTGDEVCGLKQSYSTASSSDGIRSRIAGTFAPITGLAEITATGALARSIRKFGNRCMGRFLPATTYTTGTATRSTTSLTTWKQSLSSTTFLNMEAVGHTTPLTWPGFRTWPASGTPPRKGGSGIRSTVEKPLRSANWLSISANNAGSHTEPSKGETEPASALTTASPRGVGRRAWTTFKDRVRRAARRLLRIAIPMYASAPVRVQCVKYAGRMPVFNLSVAEQPEYFANGVLVHNCRYGLMAFKDDVETLQPRESYVGDRLQQVAAKYDGPATDINLLIQASMNAQAQWDKNQVQVHGFSAPRMGSNRHRSTRVN